MTVILKHLCMLNDFRHIKTEGLPKGASLHGLTERLDHISLASFLWDTGKQYSPRCDAAERGVPSEAILFAQRNVIEK